jgi:CRISPR-associated protein Cmr6
MQTKAKVLQTIITRAAQYKTYFQQRNKYTELMAGKGNTFKVKCLWRVRVGGMRGPEDMLLPAFDAAGMPYIPSSSLRGVARSQGVRSLTQAKIDALKKTKPKITPDHWKQAAKEAETEIASYLGSLEANDEHRMGKVIFLDAYPWGNDWRNEQQGLAVDIANSVWEWENQALSYNPNPNLFLSLRKPTFIIGLKPTRHCDATTFKQVKTWLKQGLQAGIGSQVNSGYGEMKVKTDTPPTPPFLSVTFTLTGQLIHSYQYLRWNQNKNRYDGEGEAEVRPVAFKSMLRYWFRALALGVLETEVVCDRWEPMLFGAIEPQTQGWIKCRVESNFKPQRTPQEQNADCLSQSGILKLSASAEMPDDKQDAVCQLLQHLTWLMFHLGGVGQGARRPLYSRKTRPYYRGTRLRVTDVNPNNQTAWQLPDTAQQFQQQFQQQLHGFYRNLARLYGRSLSLDRPNKIRGQFIEFIGGDCKIVVCSGKSQSNKPFALDILHKLAHRGNGKYNSELCGDANSNPSPIWISDLGNYQVVTVFEIWSSPRRKFLKELPASSSSYAQIWPFK